MTFLKSMTFLKIALWGTIGTLLVAAGFPWDSWQFWCFMGTYWAVNRIGRYQGAVQAMVEYFQMDLQDQQIVKHALRDLVDKEDQNV